MRNPFRCFNSSPEVIRLTVMMYIRYPLSLRQVEDVLFERGIDICHETVRFWWNRFGPMFAAEIRKRRVRNQSYSRWRWHLDEVFVKLAIHEDQVWLAPMVG
jgi:putative transposase